MIQRAKFYSSVVSEIYFTAGMVAEKINKLKSTSAPGPDKIPARFLKEYVNVYFIPSLVII